MVLSRPPALLARQTFLFVTATIATLVSLPASAASASITGPSLVASCAGDCDGDGRVSIGEVTTCVNLFLQEPGGTMGDPTAICPVADVDRDGSVSIGEVMQCVRRFLDGCGAPPSPVTATPSAHPQATLTPTPTRTATFTAAATATPSATATPTASATPSATAAPGRALGTAALITGPSPCDGQSCYNLEVSCDQLRNRVDVLLKVGNPTAPVRGTIVFATGWTGAFLWETWSADAARVLSELRAAGFRTVQLQWSSNWFRGASLRAEGFGQLACRPATILRWVYDHLHEVTPDTAFCASGDSNGASQIAYALTQYGLADIVDAAELDGGPNWARVDIGCYGNDSLNIPLWFSASDRNIADWAFGYEADGSGPCAQRNASFRTTFQNSSLAYGTWSYVYPRTMLHFLYGDQDHTTTASHGRYYYNLLHAAGSPRLQIDTVPNTPHTIVSNTVGANMIRDVLLNECRPQ